MKTVSLFIPCMIDLFLPEIGESTYRLLQSLGVNPIYHPDQTCCGQPAINAGYAEQARKAAKHFIDVFGDDEVVVSPSGSCVCTVRYHYPELLSDEPGWFRRAHELAGRIFELSQYIVDILGISDCGASFRGKIAYHESCHILRGLGVSAQPRKLISGVKGAELVTLKGADSCCGFGGEFSNNYPDISEAMAKGKCDNYLESGADILLLCEPGCLLNIGGYLSRNHPEKRIMHLAQFLEASLDADNKLQKNGTTNGN